MASTHSEVADIEPTWNGKGSPFKISYGKMMMWYFLISDALTFGGLLSALGFMRVRHADVWPVSENVFHAFPLMGHTHLPLLYVALMTFILIISSVTMVLAVEAGHRMNKKKATFWLAATIVGGLFFLLSQVWEWSHFIHGSENGALKLTDGTMVQFAEGNMDVLQFPDGTIVEGSEVDKIKETASVVHGANLKENEYGHPLYADFFFFITGFHGFHVFSGVVINFIVLLSVIKGVFQRRGHYEMVEKAGLYWHFVDLVWVFVFTFFYLL